jgi:hypothetical protein
MPNSVLIGSSPKFRAVLENVQTVAPVSCASSSEERQARVKK